MNVSASTLILNSSRLTVQIDLPGSNYRGSRFDWSGFITQVTLDGSHTFCVPESLKPGAGSGGRGLCNEFGIDLPIGFEEIKPGELFPKLGIGLLRKPDEKPYDFSRPYEIARPFDFHVENTPSLAKVTIGPDACGGYAARLVRKFQVAENWLELSYSLENTGQKRLRTHEYAHNFVAIDEQPIGSDYLLRLLGLVDLDPDMVTGLDLLAINGKEIGFTGALSGLYLRPQGVHQESQPQWEIELKSKHTGLHENDDFQPLRVAIWGTLHVISPEIFIGIDLQPGEVQKWTRRYTFYD